MLRRYRPAAWLSQRMSCLCLVDHETRLWWFWCQFRRRPQVSPIINFGTAVSSMNSWAYCFSPEDVLWVLSVSDGFFYELLNCCCVSRRGKHISVQVLWVEYRKHRNMWTQWLPDMELYWVSSSFSVSFCDMQDVLCVECLECFSENSKSWVELLNMCVYILVIRLWWILHIGAVWRRVFRYCICMCISGATIAEYMCIAHYA